jgi:hypothetical protein
MNVLIQWHIEYLDNGDGTYTITLTDQLNAGAFEGSDFYGGAAQCLWQKIIIADPFGGGPGYPLDCTLFDGALDPYSLLDRYSPEGA